MAQSKVFIINVLLAAVVFAYGCVSSEIRLPNSVKEVYSNTEVQQSLLMAAENKILFSLSQESLTEVEKTEIDPQCKKISTPIWSEKLIVYLNKIRQNPEWFTKFHVLEIKKGDQPQVQLQKDLDGATVLSIHYVMTEVRGTVSMNTENPCQRNMAELIGKTITKTDFEFPKVDQLSEVFSKADERKPVERFNFNSQFLKYLAERGAIFKFNHEQSFEKNTQGRFVMVEALNKLAAESLSANLSYLNLFIKKINQNSIQAELIQLFGLVSDSELKAGVKVDTLGEFARKSLGQPDITYLFVTYKTEGENILVTPLAGFESCLKEQASQFAVQMRKPASVEERESFLSPGFQCETQGLLKVKQY